jgi:hypothetical protein
VAGVWNEAAMSQSVPILGNLFRVPAPELRKFRPAGCLEKVQFCCVCASSINIRGIDFACYQKAVSKVWMWLISLERHEDGTGAKGRLHRHAVCIGADKK